MKFIYNGRIYNPSNLEKKLKKLGITINDIEIIPEDIKKEKNELDDFHLTHIPYLEPIESGYAVHYLKIEDTVPSNWIRGRIENNKIII